MIASRLEGVLLVDGHVVLSRRPRIAGCLMAQDTVLFTGAQAWIDAGAVDPGQVPAGFPVDRRIVRRIDP